MTTSPWEGYDLGVRRVAYTETDAILYALSVGARADEYHLVDETRLRVLPTFALTLGQWATDGLGAAGAFDISRALHGSQVLEVFGALPPRGELELTSRVAHVWDKGKAAVFDVDVECELFRARWSLYAPGAGDFGGERGPSATPAEEEGETVHGMLQTRQEQAALYRLNGDRHRIHIDPEAAAGIGQPRPILHGLCTLAAGVLQVARTYGRDATAVRRVEGRFGAPVLPGSALPLRSARTDERVRFTVGEAAPFAIAAGLVEFTS